MTQLMNQGVQQVTEEGSISLNVLGEGCTPKRFHDGFFLSFSLKTILCFAWQREQNHLLSKYLLLKQSHETCIVERTSSRYNFLIDMRLHSRSGAPQMWPAARDLSSGC